MKRAICVLTLLIPLGWGVGTAASAQGTNKKEQVLHSLPTIPLKPKLIKPKPRAAVPEPGTLLLVGSGLLGVAAWKMFRGDK